MNHLSDSAWTVSIGMYWFDSIKISRERITTADGETTSILRLMTNKNRNNNNATLQVRPLSNKANINTQAGCPGNKRNTSASHWILTPCQPHRVSSGQSNFRLIRKCTFQNSSRVQTPFSSPVCNNAICWQYLAVTARASWPSPHRERLGSARLL